MKSFVFGKLDGNSIQEEPLWKTEIGLRRESTNLEVPELYRISL